jgi:hypothetical protein
MMQCYCMFQTLLEQGNNHAAYAFKLGLLDPCTVAVYSWRVSLCTFQLGGREVININ